MKFPVCRFMKKKITPLMIFLGLGIITGFVIVLLNINVIGGALIGGCTAALVATIKNRLQQEDKSAKPDDKGI